MDAGEMGKALKLFFVLIAIAAFLAGALIVGILWWLL